jgi:hypothetical protein
MGSWSRIGIERYEAKVYWKREHRSEIVPWGGGPHANVQAPRKGHTARRAAADMWGASTRQLAQCLVRCKDIALPTASRRAFATILINRYLFEI